MFIDDPKFTLQKDVDRILISLVILIPTVPYF